MGSCCLLGSGSSRLLERMGKALTGALCESRGLCGESKMWCGSLCDRCGRVFVQELEVWAWYALCRPFYSTSILITMIISINEDNYET